MTDEKKKMTAQGSSVGADDGQSISKNSKTTIPDPDEKNNSPGRDLEELYRKMRRMSDPAYLHTVTLDELMDNVFDGKSAVIENLLYTGAYILAGAPKIGKSFLVAQIAHHVSTGQDLWGYKVHQGTVLYLALEDDESRLQRRMFRMFGVEGTSSLHFATNAKMIGGGLDEQLEKFVREHSDTKLIIVDRLLIKDDHRLIGCALLYLQMRYRDQVQHRKYRIQIHRVCHPEAGSNPGRYQVHRLLFPP